MGEVRGDVERAVGRCGGRCAEVQKEVRGDRGMGVWENV